MTTIAIIMALVAIGLWAYTVFALARAADRILELEGRVGRLDDAATTLVRMIYERIDWLEADMKAHTAHKTAAAAVAVVGSGDRETVH